MRDFVSKRTEKRIIELMDQSNEAKGNNDYHNAREFYREAEILYGKFCKESKKEIPHIDNRLNDIHQRLFFG